MNEIDKINITNFLSRDNIIKIKKFGRINIAKKISNLKNNRVYLKIVTDFGMPVLFNFVRSYVPKVHEKAMVNLHTKNSCLKVAMIAKVGSESEITQPSPSAAVQACAQADQVCDQPK